MRRRRRPSVDLLVHGCTPRYLLELPTRYPRPIDPPRASRRSTARRPRCSPSRTAWRRGSAARKRCSAYEWRRPSRSSGAFDGPEEDGLVRRAHPVVARGGSRARRHGDPLPDERALGRLRAGARGRGDPYQAARGRLPDAAAARGLREKLGARARQRVAASAAERLARRGRTPPSKRLGEQELVRQADLGRFVDLGAGSTTARRPQRFLRRPRGALRSRRGGRGVSSSRIPPRQRARVEAVSAPRGGEGSRSGRRRSPRRSTRRRRLLYVGMTRPPSASSSSPGRAGRSRAASCGSSASRSWPSRRSGSVSRSSRPRSTQRSGPGAASAQPPTMSPRSSSSTTPPGSARDDEGSDHSRRAPGGPGDRADEARAVRRRPFGHTRSSLTAD